MIYPDLAKPKGIGDMPAIVVISRILIAVFLLLAGGWAALLCGVGSTSTDAPVFYLVAFLPLGAVILGLMIGRRG